MATHDSDLPSRLEISASLLVRNGILNITGQALPLLIGLVSVPLILSGLGAERFGLLAFSWTLTGAFSVLDLGLAGAVTKFVAEALGRGDRGSVRGILWSAVVGQLVMGAAGGAVVVIGAGPLVSRFLNVPLEIRTEAIQAFRIVGLILPVMLLINSFRGALEAAQRFDIAAAVKGASSASTFLVPLVGVYLDWGLPRIIGLLLVVRVVLLVALVAACVRTLPALVRPIHAGLGGLRRLLRFGGWIAVSGVVGFAISYSDRFIIGNALTMAHVAYYTVPVELIGRLGLIAGTLAAVLFPAFSTLGGASDLPRLRLLFSRSIKYVVLATGPAFALLAVFAPDVLRVWLGPAAAAQSAPVLRILAVGAAFQVLAVIPAAVVQGFGRPELHAKFYLLHAPLYVATMWWLVRVDGIHGVGLAWSGRLAVEALWLLWIAGRVGLWSWPSARWAARRIVAPVAGVSASAALLNVLPVALGQRVAMIALLMIGFGWWAWLKALEPEERRWMLKVASGLRRSSMRPAPPPH